jgi:CRISPR-associated protein Cas2
MRKNTWLIAYDITDDKRRTQVAQKLKGFGTRLQYSVWRCELSPMALHQLKGLLAPLLDHRDDQLLLIDLGPAGGRADACVQTLGKPYTLPHRGAVIL